MSRTLETESSVATMPADKKNEVLPVDKEPSVEKQENDDEEQTDDSACRRNLKRLVAFLHANDFLVLVVLAILLARAYPPLGAIYLYPKITADWLAVAIIFLLSGLNLHTEQLKYAFKQVSFNMYIQVYNFLVVSAVVFGVSRALAAWGLLSQGLADGLVICSTLSVSINMGIVMTKAVGGDEAAAIFDAAFGNLMGVFISPALILGYLKEWGDIALGTVFYKLALKVLLPIAIGQLIQKTSKPIVDFLEKYKKHFGKIQLYCLIFIIYTVFCKTFINGKQSKIGDILILVLFVFLLQVFLLILAWYSLKLLFKDKPKLRAMGIFGCTQKTISSKSM
jgi:sodium/bile acid cotransporter 7